MDFDQAIAALNNPVRRQILIWLKDRSNFPPALPEHRDVAHFPERETAPFAVEVYVHVRVAGVLGGALDHRVAVEAGGSEQVEHDRRKRAADC